MKFFLKATFFATAFTLFSCAEHDTIQGSSSYDPNMPCQCDSPYYGLTREQLVDMKWPDFQKYPGYLNCTGRDSIEFIEFVVKRKETYRELLQEKTYKDSVSTEQVYEEMDKKLGID